MSRAPLILTSALMLQLLSCSVSSEGAPVSSSPPPTSDAGVVVTAPEILRFLTDTARVDPGESVTVRLQISGSSEPVRLSLVGADSGAYLDQSEVNTDGFVDVTVTAPGTQGTFTVLASAGGAQASITIHVGRGGRTEIVVAPQYDGVRSFPSWDIQVFSDGSCKDRGEEPARQVGSDFSAAPIVIEDVPAGVPLAVVVRGGTLTEGCADVPALPAADSTRVVVLTTDLPLALAHDLDITLNVEPTAEFSALLEARIDAIAAATRGDAADGIAALLDAMRADLTPTERAAFELARMERDWYSRVGAALTEAGQIRTPGSILRALLLRSTQRLYQPGSLVGSVGAVASLPSTTFIQWSTVADVPARVAGFPETLLVTADPEPEDTLRLGGTLPWLPHTLLMALLELDVAESGQDPISALEEQLDCDAIAEALTTAVTADDQTTVVDAFPSCDRACTADLCWRGLEENWYRASTLPAIASTVTIAAAGRAELGDNTNILGFDGSWLGVASLGASDKVPMKGTFRAEQAP